MEISLKDLLEAGAHFGHQARRWNPKIAPYLFGQRQGIYIFDLASTRQKLVEALDFLQKATREGKLFLFVGTKRQASEKITQVAQKLGVPYINHHWIGGLFTNFPQIKKSIDKLAQMREAREAGEYKEFTKKEQLIIDREIARLSRLFGGIQNLEKLPDVVFIVDTHQEEAVVREAIKIGITTVGIVDSNADPTIIDFPIPMNDDAVRALEFVLDLVQKAIEKGKRSQKLKTQNV